MLGGAKRQMGLTLCAILVEFLVAFTANTRRISRQANTLMDLLALSETFNLRL